MKGLNKVSLIGHLGKDPEIRQISNEQQVAHVSLATTESYRDKTGKTVSQTDWHPLVLWGRLAVMASEHMRKGSLVYVDGKIKTRKYEDKLGQSRYVTEIIVEKVILLPSK